MIRIFLRKHCFDQIEKYIKSILCAQIGGKYSTNTDRFDLIKNQLRILVILEVDIRLLTMIIFVPLFAPPNPSIPQIVALILIPVSERIKFASSLFIFRSCFIELPFEPILFAL